MFGHSVASLLRWLPTYVHASPEDRDYNNYLLNHSILFDTLLISDATYALLTTIFSPRPECRPSLAEIRAEVLATDTFFPSDDDASVYGLTERMKKRTMAKCRMP